jgi:hypothetical protein
LNVLRRHRDSTAEPRRPGGHGMTPINKN